MQKLPTSLSRGDGGQNRIGTELGELLESYEPRIVCTEKLTRATIF